MADKLNSFFACFEINKLQSVIPTSAEEEAFTVTKHDVRRTFRRVNTSKTAGPDRNHGHVLKACAD